MTKKLFISQLSKKYRIVYLHNPKHFFLNSLYIEDLPNGQKLLCANPRPHSKQFHRLAILKPKKKMVSDKSKMESKEFVQNNTVKLDKPFNGIFQD